MRNGRGGEKTVHSMQTHSRTLKCINDERNNIFGKFSIKDRKKQI